MRMPWERLPRFLSDVLKDSDGGDIYEIRLRLGESAEICRESGSGLIGEKVTPEMMTQAIASLTAHSVYACEPQMREGYFTLPGGARVGIAGRCAGPSGELQSITSLSIRIPRRIPPESGTVMKFLSRGGRMGSCLILSEPRMGKTTLLRSLIEKASEMGYHVAVADERDELAGGESLGRRVDVLANCPKRAAIPRLVRSMSPEIVATDEIGHPLDAETIADARRCGCAVFATAHAAGYEGALGRAALKTAIDEGIFDCFVELGLKPGRVTRVLGEGGRVLWTDGA